MTVYLLILEMATHTDLYRKEQSVIVKQIKEEKIKQLLWKGPGLLYKSDHCHDFRYISEKGIYMPCVMFHDEAFFRVQKRIGQ